MQKKYLGLSFNGKCINEQNIYQAVLFLSCSEKVTEILNDFKILKMLLKVRSFTRQQS